ncbi:MAG: glycosyltransferase family 4 protein [Aquabacterium sp.]|uniref:glycosyltransferase family 4 protein n=1 Tax=Aquabacterium sp. TaxID=1872578 RepID=UPI00271FE3F6|nr:glycosyltransferase family 4 protein [Aquabacterium sp.]MDO9003935.1 glycosyltransferase family 4 protein [Aquabacterium sp.]
MALAFLVPGQLDQLTGGYLYDRHIVEGLRARGQAVTVVELPGQYPQADAPTRASAAAALAQLPDQSMVIIDGLALPGLADCLQAQASRLHLVGMIHHPLSLETGLDADSACHYAQLEAELWPHLQGAICPSENTARALLAAGLAADRVAVVSPGTHRPASIHRATSHAPLQLLAVGTITPRKGHLLLVDALAHLPELDWRLSCIGSLTRDPAATTALQERITAHGLGDRIALLGEQTPEQLAQAYRQADLFALPSYHEGYGMVFAEALAHGLPILATTAVALTDTIPADALLLVSPGDLPALRDALERALCDGDLRARLRAAALRAASTLPDWDRTVQDWMAALEKVTR